MIYEIIWKYNGKKEYIESGILELYVYGLLVKPKMKKLLRWQNNPENKDVFIKSNCVFIL
jgi:hypothetical protein